MFIVGLTGGIGSGKTTVSNFFKELGVPVYYADNEAKSLMLNSEVIKPEFIKLFGANVYSNNELNRRLIREAIFKDESLLKTVNSIVHPQVALHFNSWLKDHSHAPYVIKEAAIIFENNLQNQYDCIITVVSDKAVRIERIMNRDSISLSSVEAIMEKQLSDEEKIEKSDFVIFNTTLKSLKDQAHKIHHKLLDLANKT